jgi:guanylate kinase
VVDFDYQIGQAVIGGLIIAGYVINQWQARAAAKKVATVTHNEAEKVATRLEDTNREHSEKIEEIHVLVNDRLEQALREIADLKEQLREALKT